MKILFVDDEEIIRRGLLMMDWSSIGITDVCSAANGLEAIEVLKQCNMDVVVSDIRMPGLDGLGLAEYIAQHAGRIKVILLTGFSDFAYAQTAIKYGVFDYLLKPIAPKQLLETVKAAIQSLQAEAYTRKIVSEYKETSSSRTTAQQIQHSFRHLGEHTKTILEDIAEHYNQNLSLNKLAEDYHFSAMYVSRLIKKETGFSFVEILTSIRLMHAARLLRTESTKVNLICEKVGFNDQRYFSQVFKKAFGCTPLEYRKLVEEQKEYSIMDLLEKNH